MSTIPLMTESLYAHGVGPPGDLPMSVGTLSLVAAAALIISFAALVSGWREPQFPDAGPGRPFLRVDGPIGKIGMIIGRGLGLCLVGLALVASFVVADDTMVNIAPRIVFVALWVLVPVGSVLFGDLWRWLSPFEILASVRDRRFRPATERDWGLQIAAALLGAFLWLELAYHNPAGRTPLAILLVVWTVWSGLGALLKGRTWLRSYDPLAALVRLIAAMSPVHVANGYLHLRRPLVGLGQVPTQKGLAALVLIVLGGTSFDGLSRTTWWEQIVAGRLGWGATAVNSVGLIFSMALVTALFLACVRWMQRRDGNEDVDFEDGFALSLVPVAVGYAIAHYIGMAVFEGQQLLIQLSDPLDRGWNLFGKADDYVDYRVVSPTVMAAIQALGIAGGHLAGVIVGHDRALATLRRKDDVTGQVPLVVLLASLTAIALVLLVEA